ncbi:MAG: O-antigen ligase family protein, partial [Flavobacteriales bacterium]
MNSIFSEPAYFAATISPAFFTAVYNLFQRNTIFINKFQSVFIALVYPLTFSSLGILAIFFTIILLLLNLGTIRYTLVFIPLLIVAITYSYKNVPEFRDRWDGTIEVYSTANIYDYDIHGSSFVLYNNSHVAWENFKRHPLFGTGLGGHPSAFDKYTLTNEIGAVQIDFNKMDANSMFLRLMSETGLYGLSIVVLLLFRSWIFKVNSMDEETWVMSNGLAIIILIYLIRQ